MCNGNVKCAECNKRAAENFGGSSVSQQPIGEFFEKNKEAIAQVFIKHGMSDVPVTPLYAGLAYKAKGMDFAADMAPIFHPEVVFANYNERGQEWHFKRHMDHNKEVVHSSKTIATVDPISGFEEDKAAKAIGITGSILAGLGTMGMGIAQNLGHKHLENAANAAPMQSCPDGRQPNPDGSCNRGPEVKLIFGLRPLHIGIIGTLFIAAVVFFLMTEKPAAVKV